MKYLKTFENYTKNDTVLDIYCLYVYDFPKEFLPLKNTLTKLNCWENHLSFLPELPKMLKELNCWENHLSFLPELPNTLIDLYTSDNNLSILPELPNSLKYLSCAHNNWIEPIPIDYYNKIIEQEGHNIYNGEQKKKFKSYEFQKEFVEKYPFRIRDLEPIGIDPEIRKEYAYLWDFDQYLD